MAVPKKKIKPVGVVKVVAKIPPPPEKRNRVKVCTDGDTGPYVLCDPKDFNAVRKVLRDHEYDTSLDPTAITDGSTKEGTAMGSLINVPDLKAGKVKALQKEFDTKFPNDDEVTKKLGFKNSVAKARKRRKL